MRSVQKKCVGFSGPPHVDGRPRRPELGTHLSKKRVVSVCSVAFFLFCNLVELDDLLVDSKGSFVYGVEDHAV